MYSYTGIASEGRLTVSLIFKHLRHVGWRSTSEAEGYIEESIGNKLKIPKSIFHQQETSGILRSFRNTGRES